MNNRMKELISNLNSQGVNTSALIKDSGVSRSQFYAILKGDYSPTASTMINISKALNSSVPDVFFSEEKEGDDVNE